MNSHAPARLEFYAVGKISASLPCLEFRQTTGRVDQGRGFVRWWQVIATPFKMTVPIKWKGSVVGGLEH